MKHPKKTKMLEIKMTLSFLDITNLLKQEKDLIINSATPNPKIYLQSVIQVEQLEIQKE